MMTYADLKALGLFEARLPRYTSYPTATVFGKDAGGPFQAEALAALPPEKPISVYVHIPFCERLCWFCACRTQGVRSLGPVEAYLDALLAEIKLVASRIPDGVRMGQLHLGGGTPTILPPHLITRLVDALKEAIPPTSPFEFSVEIDPMLVDSEKIDALAIAGMTRTSIGVQDFDPEVQAAIGREQPFDNTRDCVDMLRAAGITSLNMDLVYGLPGQDLESLRKTFEQVLSMEPDRLALFGYAHVPQMAKRQRLIPEDRLPGDADRLALFREASRIATQHGLEPIGIDHFAKPGDSLHEAAQSGHLRRNFQGYTTDRFETLVGLGASSISRFKQGYVQNASQTGAYGAMIRTGILAGVRGHAMAGEDALRARVIEMLMCDFRVDLNALRAEFGDLRCLDAPLNRLRALYWPHINMTDEQIEIRPRARPMVRLIAHLFDAYRPEGALYSRVS